MQTDMLTYIHLLCGRIPNNYVDTSSTERRNAHFPLLTCGLSVVTFPQRVQYGTAVEPFRSLKVKVLVAQPCLTLCQPYGL